MDLFDQLAPMGDVEGEGYGRSGEMKKTQYMLQLLGTPWDPDTLKCIIAAAEQGMEMHSGFLNTLENKQNSKEYRNIFEFGTTPGLKESDYYLAGVNGILAFINARGLGYSLIPKNVNKAAEQDYWIDVAVTEAQPNIETLVQEQILGPMADSNHSPDETAISKAKQELNSVLNVLEQQIGNNPYISDKYSMADVHWLALIHLLALSGNSELINQYSQIKRWYSSLETRKSNCGQDIVAFSLLPNVDDIHNKKMSNVEISDF